MSQRYLVITLPWASPGSCFPFIILGEQCFSHHPGHHHSLPGLLQLTAFRCQLIRPRHSPDDKLPAASHYPLQTMQNPCLSSKTACLVCCWQSSHFASGTLSTALPVRVQTPSSPLTQLFPLCIVFLPIRSWLVSSGNSGLGSNVTPSEKSSMSPSNCFPINPSVFFLHGFTSI